MMAVARAEGSTAAIGVALAAPEERPMLERLLQLYLHDFSTFAPWNSPYGEVDADGMLPYPPGIDAYWREPGCLPLLIRADGRVAGFVLLNRWSALDQPVDQAVAEFFVMRKFRRAGIGTGAARAAVGRAPGRWEVAVAAYNPDALPFWRAALRPFGPAEREGDGRRWSGTVLCFDTNQEVRR